MKPIFGVQTLCSILLVTALLRADAQTELSEQAGQPQRSLEVTQAKTNLPGKNEQSTEAEDRKLFMPWMSPFMFGMGGGMMPQQGGYGQAGQPGMGQVGQPGAVGNLPADPSQALPNMNSMVAGNMMVGNTMMHPMINPFSPANPFSPMSPGNPFNPLNPLNQRRPPNRFSLVSDDDIINGDQLVSPVDLASDVFDDQNGLRVVNKCGNVKTQALEIANRLMKKQNNKIFRELISYLVKAKFLIGMTEIKLTRALRKRVFGLMTAFSSLDHSHFNFVDPEKIVDYSSDADLSKFKTVYPSIDDEDKSDVEEERREYAPLGKKQKV